MYNILIFGMNDNQGGVEPVIMNYYRVLKNSKIHFDFLCNTHNKIAYEDEIIAHGSKVYHIAPRSKTPIRYYKELRDFFHKHGQNYDCLWSNQNTLVNIDYLKWAKKAKIKKIIIQSHNSSDNTSKLKSFIHNRHKRVLARYATDYWAVSDIAADFFFNKKLLPKVKIVKNSIDINKFKYSEEKRESIRKKYNLEDAIIVGNVGRLGYQKNQHFAITLFESILKTKKKAYLILVGNGEDREKLLDQAKKLNIQNKIIFAGMQNDMQAWYSAFDLFLFPSHFEGLPMAALEAQANGLPVLAASDGMPTNVKINNNFHFLSLSDTQKEWTHKIIQLLDSNRRENFENIEKNFTINNLNLNYEKTRLEKLFLKN